MQSKRHTQVPQDPWSKKESNATKDDVKKEGEIEMCSLRRIENNNYNKRRRRRRTGNMRKEKE